MTGLWHVIRDFLRLAVPYFRSEERWRARMLLGGLLAAELVQVALSVQLNLWNRRFFDALQLRQMDAWLRELLVFFVLGCATVGVALVILVANQALLILWRRWMTRRYLARWLESGNHYRLQVGHAAIDNPDQRISMDVANFLTQSLSISTGLLRSVTTLGSFVFILWALSSTPLPIRGHDYAFTGYLVIAALVYAVVGTLLTHLAGRRLVQLNFLQERYEADFRFDLVRVREHSEQIALLRGEPVEQGRLMGRYQPVYRNAFAVLWRTLKTTFVTSGWNQLALVLPSLLIAPAYFAGFIQLGLLFQISGAFVAVQASFSFFITTYTQLAGWKVTIDRLRGFDEAMAQTEDAARTPPRVDSDRRADAAGVEVRGLGVSLPGGRALLRDCDFSVAAGDSVLLTGPSGAGKSTLFRALAGIWPFGSGRVSWPRDARVMIVPQRPYLPLGTLAAAIAFPESPQRWTRAEIVAALEAAGLGALAPQLDAEEAWGQRLSLGEQQRVAIARALLHAPDVLLLDESTASLDEAAERALYELLRRRLPRAAIVSIGHRSSVRAYHRRRLHIVPAGDAARIEEIAADAMP